MVYKDNFIAVLKCNGKILREKDQNLVYLPFNSEYSILLKNQNSKDSLVRISIDGQVIGNDLIVRKNCEVEIERFTSNLNVGNKFKFIQKTDKIVDHRGDKIDDGMIRIEYWFEEDKPVVIHDHHYHYYNYYSPYDTIERYVPSWHKDTVFGSTINDTLSQSNYYSNNNVREINNDEGITVKGNESCQKFNFGNIEKLEENSKVIVLRLRGYFDNNKQVSCPITTRDKLTCKTCGTKSKSNIKFCPECGTYLWG